MRPLKKKNVGGLRRKKRDVTLMKNGVKVQVDKRRVKEKEIIVYREDKDWRAGTYIRVQVRPLRE